MNEPWLSVDPFTLSECPFCGTSAYLQIMPKKETPSAAEYRCSCGSDGGGCDARGPITADADSAVVLWNSRILSTYEVENMTIALNDRVDAVRKAIKDKIDSLDREKVGDAIIPIRSTYVDAIEIVNRELGNLCLRPDATITNPAKT